jgi:hypothetical protein
MTMAVALIATAVGFTACKKPIVVDTVSLDKTELMMFKNDTITLTVTILPDNAEDKSVKWSSSNATVAAVDQNGVVVALAGGTAVIMVTTNDGNKSASCNITVPIDSGTLAGSPIKWILLNEKTMILRGEGAMKDYTNLDQSKPWDNPNSKIKDIIVEEGVTAIGKYAFYRAMIETITVPTTVTSIGQGAFTEASELKQITFASDVGLQDINDYVFQSCWSLKTLKLPSTLRALRTAAFQYSGLETIEIPLQVTTIQQAAFGGCDSLKELTVNWANPVTCAMQNSTDIGNGVFKSISTAKLATIKLNVPAGSKTNYEAHDVWKYFNIVEKPN